MNHAADGKPLDIYWILKVLPHRYPFLLVDRILEMEPGKRVVGLKNVTVNEEFFQGHFPGNPVMPGVLVLEALAQTGGCLIFASDPSLKGRKWMYLAGVDKSRFRRPVIPGDQLMMTVEIQSMRSRLVKCRGEAHVEGQLCAEADLLCSLVDAEMGS